MVIGVTEGGDPGIDFSWVQRTGRVDGVVLITKELTDRFLDEVLACPAPVLLHVTCTGFGGTVLEPFVPDFRAQLRQLQVLLDRGFPAERAVLRIDPLIPTEKGLERAQRVVDAACGMVSRFRISVLDQYPHVRQRFREKGIPLPYGERFSALPEQFRLVDQWLLAQRGKGRFEACAEPKLVNAAQQGCVSAMDLELLGLSLDREYGVGFQRRGCLCLSCKRELLPRKSPCAHGCLYCFWKDAPSGPLFSPTENPN